MHVVAFMDGSGIKVFGMFISVQKTTPLWVLKAQPKKNTKKQNHKNKQKTK